jgi:hypothetical protein
MPQFKLAKAMEAEFEDLPYKKVVELRQKMAHQIADIDLSEPVEDVKKWYRDHLLQGMESDGYLNDSLSTLIYLYISALTEYHQIDLDSADDFWRYLDNQETE